MMKRRLRYCVLALVGPFALGLCALTASARDATPNSNPTAAQLAQQIWDALPNTRLGVCGDAFDYFPHSGPQQFACHLLSITPIQALLKLSATPIFKSGPHSPKLFEYNLNHDWKFGRYHPAFVKWVSEQMIPAITTPERVKRHQAHYNEYVKPFVTTLYLTYQKMLGEPACAQLEVKRYKQYIMSRRSGADVQDDPDFADMPYERYFYFMNPLFCANPNKGFDFFHGRGFDSGYSGNAVKGCVSWWLRRSIDGTAPAMWSALQQIVRAYDEPLSRRRYASKTEIDRGVKALLDRFELAVKRGDSQAILKTMDPDYVREQHDQLQKGNTERFLSEFFCGAHLKTKRYKCVKIKDIKSMKLIKITPAEDSDRSWSVDYQVESEEVVRTLEDESGDTLEMTRKFTIKLDFIIVGKPDTQGKVRYGIVGAVG